MTLWKELDTYISASLDKQGQSTQQPLHVLLIDGSLDEHY